MKAITAYECDHCKKIYRSKSGISKHEKRCFKNPATRSCITCEHLDYANFLNGNKLNELQERIVSFQEPGTFKERNVYDSGGYPISIPELLPEYQFLLEYEGYNYCSGLNCKLDKLRTNCGPHKNKTI